MANSRGIKYIRQLFPTERYKSFRYQTNPFQAIIGSLLLVLLASFQIFSWPQVFIWAGMLLFSELPFSPVTSLLTAIHNLSYDRKKLKSWVMIVSLSLAVLAGVLLAFFGSSQIPILMAFIDFFSSAFCSPTLFFIGLVVGERWASGNGIVSSFVGLALGIFLTSQGIVIPLMVDVVFICVVGTTFIASVLAKQGMRAYYKHCYGHSNADGYEMNKSIAEQEEFVTAQALKFGVTENEFLDLKNYCYMNIREIKEGIGERIRYEDHHAFKDIYYSLMNPHATEEDIHAAKDLLRLSSTCTIKRDMQPRSEDELSFLRTGVPEEALHYNPNMRILKHRANLIATRVASLDERGNVVEYAPRVPLWRRDGMFVLAPGCGIDNALIAPFLDEALPIQDPRP